MKKIPIYTEVCYVLGILLPALSGAMMIKADFGLSMIVAPAYVLHCKLSQYHSFFTFGACSYLFEAALLLLMVLILRRFKLSYLFSFVTAVLVGLALDGCGLLLQNVPADTLLLRLLFFAGSIAVCSLGIAFIWHTYIPPEVYELFVKEVSHGLDLDIGKVKTVYDYSSLALSLLLSFLFFHALVGIGWGTVACTLLNGVSIAFISKWMDKHLVLKDALPFRRLFQK